MKRGKIFIQMAAYRDPQMLPTIRDCIDKAFAPENLVFCIAWQHCKDDVWDTLAEYKDDARFKVIDMDHSVSKGVCWARNTIQQRYDDEEYTLQLDSHHRFVQNWDVELITMMRQLAKAGHQKPLLTSYMPSFDPDKDPEARTPKPYQLTFDRFTPDGVIFFLPATIDDFESRQAPLPCRFYSAHFCFTLGSFCKEVQHDPQYYFHGEEISIAVRAYTWGYDLFTPHKMIAWHEYTRRYRKKHWDDHKDWNEMNRTAYTRLRSLLGIDGASAVGVDFGRYGLGSVRTVQEYERYAGIRFRDRSVQQYTLDHKLPPNPLPTASADQGEYDKSFIQVFRHCIDIHSMFLPHDDYQFVAVIFEDAKGGTLHRQDILPEELKTLRDPHDDFYKIWRRFTYEGDKPYKYIVWPHSAKHGWCSRIEDVIHK